MRVPRWEDFSFFSFTATNYKWTFNPFQYQDKCSISSPLPHISHTLSIDLLSVDASTLLTWREWGEGTSLQKGTHLPSHPQTHHFPSLVLLSPPHHSAEGRSLPRLWPLARVCPEYQHFLLPETVHLLTIHWTVSITIHTSFSTSILKQQPENSQKSPLDPYFSPNSVCLLLFLAIFSKDLTYICCFSSSPIHCLKKKELTHITQEYIVKHRDA